MKKRLEISKNYSHFRESAVMILIDDQGRLILTKRTKKVKSHKGQFSFPGGKKEEKDATFLETALRETEEEIGISKFQIDSIKEIKPSCSPRGFIIRPYLGYLRGKVVFKKSEDEVDRIVRVPLDFFKQTTPTFRIFNIKGVRVRADFYKFGPHIIWGATARIISLIKKDYALK